jgi:hypothetical protein
MYGITRLAAVVHSMNKKLAGDDVIKTRLIQGIKGEYAEYYI